MSHFKELVKMRNLNEGLVHCLFSVNIYYLKVLDLVFLYSTVETSRKLTGCFAAISLEECS